MDKDKVIHEAASILDTLVRMSDIIENAENLEDRRNLLELLQTSIQNAAPLTRIFTKAILVN